jgi:hypothetical protein
MPFALTMEMLQGAMNAGETTSLALRLNMFSPSFFLIPVVYGLSNKGIIYAAKAWLSSGDTDLLGSPVDESKAINAAQCVCGFHRMGNLCAGFVSFARSDQFSGSDGEQLGDIVADSEHAGQRNRDEDDTTPRYCGCCASTKYKPVPLSNPAAPPVQRKPPGTPKVIRKSRSDHVELEDDEDGAYFNNGSEPEPSMREQRRSSFDLETGDNSSVSADLTTGFESEIVAQPQPLASRSYRDALALMARLSIEQLDVKAHTAVLQVALASCLKVVPVAIQPIKTTKGQLLFKVRANSESHFDAIVARLQSEDCAVTMVQELQDEGLSGQFGKIKLLLASHEAKGDSNRGCSIA